MEKVLILGINGFIGKNFIDYILKNNLIEVYHFIGVDRTVSDNNTKNEVKMIKADLANYESLQSLILLERPDYIINLAGVLSAVSFDEMLKINAGISRDLMEIILKFQVKVKRILLVGSAAEYGNSKDLPIKESAPLRPVNEYGLSKVVQTEYAFYYMNMGLEVNIARTFNVVGKYMPVTLSVGSFLNQISVPNHNEVVHVGNLNTRRDFLDIEDVVDAYWKIITSGKSKKVYNVCSGKPIFIKDVLQHMIDKSGKAIKVEVDASLIKDHDILESYGSNSELKLDTGWINKKIIFDSLSDLL